VTFYAKVFGDSPIPPLPTFAEVMPIARMVRANSNVDAYWIPSYAQLNEEGKMVKLFCEWNAKTLKQSEK